MRHRVCWNINCTAPHSIPIVISSTWHMQSVYPFDLSLQNPLWWSQQYRMHMKLMLTEGRWMQFCSLSQILCLTNIHNLYYHPIYGYTDWLLPVLRQFLCIPYSFNKFMDVWNHCPTCSCCCSHHFQYSLVICSIVLWRVTGGCNDTSWTGAAALSRWTPTTTSSCFCIDHSMFVLFQDFLLALCKKPKSVEGEVGSVLGCNLLCHSYLSEIH